MEVCASTYADSLAGCSGIDTEVGTCSGSCRRYWRIRQNIRHYSPNTRWYLHAHSHGRHFNSAYSWL